jgi:hypothetical protein
MAHCELVAVWRYPTWFVRDKKTTNTVTFRPRGQDSLSHGYRIPDPGSITRAGGSVHRQFESH